MSDSGSGGGDKPQLRDPRSYDADAELASGKDGDKGDGGGGKDGGSGGEDGGKKKPSPFKNPIVVIALILLVVVLLIGGWMFFNHQRKFQTTDDAFIDAHIVHLAPQIAGRVQAVYAADNMLVGSGQPLVQIDPIDQAQRVAQAQAQKAQAQAQRDQASAQRVQALAVIETQSQTYRQTAAQVPGVEAQAVAAAKEDARYRELNRVNRLAVAQQQLDNATAQARQTASQAEAARRARDAAAAQVDQARTQVAAADASIRGAEAQIAAADAQLASANTQAGYARIVAPLIGHVARRNVQVGSYVQPGQELMAIVPLELWVTANFKETQLKSMRVGQRVDIKVDAYPDYDFHGHVDSFQRGAGQAFAVLPSENATGNFVKVVQRVPVKIVIDNLDDLHHPLGPGMSVRPRVRVLP